ncbi:MAG: flagellar basal body P-ring protein FlgI [Spirochaetota bacterium]|jgi:flagellar P-ring protein precursor FlgI|nr:flagellar basal body P-ring protein FlgI [Spirochaetota bacterium]
MGKRITVGILLIVFVSSAAYGAVSARIKDIAAVRGMRDNQLIGYGLVVGLGGRGDSPRSALTRQTIRALLANLGISFDEGEMQAANSAVVIVTATVTPFAREGDQIDAVVASLADARSLAGGILLQTPLKAANGTIYAVAQGQILVGGTSETTTAAGAVPKGALVERGVPASFFEDNTVRISIGDRDFTTMDNIAKALAERFEGLVYRVEDPTSISLSIPAEYRANPVAFIAALEVVEIECDTPARVVVDGKSGLVVMGENVRIGTVAVSYNGIKISVGDASGTADGKIGNSFMLPSADVRSLVDGLNQVGARAGDIISILQAIEKAGALKAKLIVM